MNRTTKIKITELNPHVICVLCGGYYINATTITECLHSFCRTCITRYLETSKYCPVCDVMVHKTRPLDYIRSDKTLQDLVYKLVPGLYKHEMKRRREYYASVDTPGVSQPPSEDRGDEFYDRIIYTEDEKISLSLELCADGIPFKTPINVHGHTGPENIRIKDVRYLQCPAAFSVGNLKKFIRMKFDLKMKYEIDIFHTAEPLPDYYSLMDIAYIYTWTRRCPLRLYYTVYERKLPPKAPDPITRGQSHRVDGSNEKRGQVSAKTKALDKNISKKRKLLEGPDDISPDLAFEKCKPYKGERRKGIGTPKKRVKKVLVEVDDSVKEAMSESEEQLARLTLDSVGENRSVPNEKGSVNLEGKQTTENDARGKVKDGDDITCDSGNQKKNVKSSGKILSKQKREEKNNPEILTNITVETNTQAGSGDSDINGAIQTDKDSASPSKQSSTQVSPGSGSISLSLFQPLNAVAVDSDDTNKSCSVNSDDKLSDQKTDNMYEFQPDETTNVSLKKGRGRPKGSKNKVNSEKASSVKKKAKESKTNNEIETSLVVSKKHPGIKSPKASKTVKRLETKEGTVSRNSPAKAKVNNGASKVSLTDKKKPLNGEKTKRKYLRKNKPENEDENDRESKRPKKETKVPEETDMPENVPTFCESVTERLETDIVSSDEKEVKEDISDNSNVLSEKEIPDKKSDDMKENVQNVSKTDEKVSDSDEKQIPLNSVSLQEPVTPLYGETPKMNESNQGLPCSPNMDSLDNSGRLVIDTSVNSEEVNGAKTKDESDKNNVKSNKTSTNGAVSENLNLKNGDFVSNRALSKEIYKNGFGSFEVNQSVSSPRNNSEIPNAHTDQYRHSVNGLSPPNPLNLMGAFSQPNMTAYLHIGHMTGNSSSYPTHDQNFDQPLDLTNNGAREEYTKGKIFKTKMLKKTYPKQDSVQNFKEKNVSSVNQFH